MSDIETLEAVQDYPELNEGGTIMAAMGDAIRGVLEENEQLRAKVTLESRGIEDMRHSIDAALAKAEEIRVKQSVLTKIVEALIPKKPLPYRELEEELQTLYAVVDDTPVTGGIREEVVRRLRVARGDVVDDADTLPEEEK